jgi:hypothetical protein
MYVWCQENQLAFDFNGPPEFKKNSYDSDFCYFMKVPT